MTSAPEKSNERPVTGDSPILRTVARIAVPITVLVSLVIFYQGHNLPGGGFIAGVLVAAAGAMHLLAFGIEKAPVVFLTASARAAVDHKNRDAIWVTAFFNIEFVRRINRNTMPGVGFDFRVQGEHEALRKKDLPGV